MMYMKDQLLKIETVEHQKLRRPKVSLSLRSIVTRVTEDADCEKRRNIWKHRMR